MKTLFLALLLSLSAPAQAFYLAALPPELALQGLFSVTSDRDATRGRVSLMIDANNLAAGAYLGSDTNEDRGGNAFLLRDIEKSSGVVLIRAQGYDVVFLQGQLNRATQEGRFRLKYLANGFSTTYGTCDFDLKRSANGWFVQNAYTGQVVTTVKIVTWSMGITTIQGICPN